MRAPTVIVSAFVCISLPFGCSHLPTYAGQSSEVADVASEALVSQPVTLKFSDVPVTFIPSSPAGI